MVADFECHIKRNRVIVDEQDNHIRGYAILVMDKRRALIARQALKCGYNSLHLYTNALMTENIAG